jgi:molybdate transport system permease protein
MTPEVYEFGQALWITFRLALVTTALLLAIAIPLAQWLNQSRVPGIWMLEALFSLPIVLPPTVIGFYLLVLMSPQHGFGHWWLQHIGHSLTFSFTGLVIGSLVYSFPFALRPLQVAFQAVNREYIEASLALGATLWQTFWHVVLPAARQGVISAAALVFAHTIGEFGVVLMIGGNIPGETRVASVALYDAVQKMDYATAHAYAIVLWIVSILLLSLIYRQQRKVLM